MFQSLLVSGVFHVLYQFILERFSLHARFLKHILKLDESRFGFKPDFNDNGIEILGARKVFLLRLPALIVRKSI